MSIFPKRTVRNSMVTIHWNFNRAHLTDQHIIPFIRIGVEAPDGSLTMLLEQYLFGLPDIRLNVATPENLPAAPKYLNKNTPLLVLADYLSGKHKKEQLVAILENIQAGVHHYFTYPIAANAPLGKYRIISEIYNNGKIKYSTTAADDYFFVEDVIISHHNHQTILSTASPEAVPVKIVNYTPGNRVTGDDVVAFELAPAAAYPVTFPENAYLVYNEERIVIPLAVPSGRRCIRNQRMIPLEKEGIVYLMDETDVAYTLTGASLAIWQQADGITTQLCTEENAAVYEEMIQHGIIVEY